MTTSERPKILCVDDEPHMLDAFERALRRDFQVLRAISANEALDILSAHPDLAIVLTDHRMPGLTGLELLMRVQSLAPDAVRAIVSAQIDLDTISEAINSALIHRFILKPWQPDVLRLHMIEALQNHRLLLERRQLERLSITDPLTQLTNHRFFQDHLRIELERADRHDRPLSLLMIDLDHFKSYNDRFGHPEGDRLLIASARLILSQIRSIDRASRYGGEEFAVVMPDTNTDDALLVAERIRTSFVQQPFPGPEGLPIPITISSGLACYPLHGRHATELIAAADHALYRAKGQGRNASVVATSPSLIL